MLKNIFFILLISANTVFAQTNIVSSFIGSQLNQTIYLAFSIASGQTCNGIVIERSEDSITFYKIGDIAGSCGSSTAPVNYFYADSFPIRNANNFYRLAPGNSDWSAIIKIYFNATNEGELIIAPNPFISYTNIRFRNPLHKITQWEMYNINGTQVAEGNTKEESFIISKNNLNAGLYFLYLVTDNKDFQKVKLIVE